MTFRLFLRQFVCSLHGHDRLLQYETDRLSLKCTTCGHQTPGWTLDAPKPRVLWAKYLRFRRRWPVSRRIA